MREYRLVYSKRKSLAIEINRDCEIIVRAPFFLSRKKIDGFVEDRSQWIEKALVRQAGRRLSEGTPPSDDEIKELRQKAKKILPQRLELFSKITGLVPTGIKITSAKTRFGSCNAKNSICFSLYLMRYPDEAIDYVVLHELAHIKYKNHGKMFYALISKYMPDYKQRASLLKNYL